MTWPTSRITGVLGLAVPTQKVRVINRAEATLAPGSLVQFDITQTDGDVSNGTIGDENSIFANVIKPATAHLLLGWFAVVVSDAAGTTSSVLNNTEMIVAIRGKVEALVYGTNAAAVTDPLAAVNGEISMHSDAATAGQKCLGYPLEVTAGATAQKITVIFEGINGFGNLVDTGG